MKSIQRSMVNPRCVDKRLFLYYAHAKVNIDAETISASENKAPATERVDRRRGDDETSRALPARVLQDEGKGTRKRKHLSASFSCWLEYIVRQDGAGCPSHCQVTLSQIHDQRCFNNRPVNIEPSSSAGRRLERVARHSGYERHADVVRTGRLRCGPA